MSLLIIFLMGVNMQNQTTDFDMSFVLGQISDITTISPYLLLENSEFVNLLKLHISKGSALDMMVGDLSDFVNNNY
jgi:hypothetical protein